MMVSKFGILFSSDFQVNHVQFRGVISRPEIRAFCRRIILVLVTGGRDSLTPKRRQYGIYIYISVFSLPIG